ncbi:unnamed protein product [Allacma fusca]|uniref:Uncharacterized protein n=1 Tax=Allacma fusca TaxID=39272 RepID=A0A8J2K1G1_9HEXA|nr:unnamed protein product [Allacma fusca]
MIFILLLAISISPLISARVSSHPGLNQIKNDPPGKHLSTSDKMKEAQAEAIIFDDNSDEFSSDPLKINFYSTSPLRRLCPQGQSIGLQMPCTDTVKWMGMRRMNH